MAEHIVIPWCNPETFWFLELNQKGVEYLKEELTSRGVFKSETTFQFWIDDLGPMIQMRKQGYLEFDRKRDSVRVSVPAHFWTVVSDIRDTRMNRVSFLRDVPGVIMGLEQVSPRGAEDFRAALLNIVAEIGPWIGWGRIIDLISKV
jgi:hypothetical protein